MNARWIALGALLFSVPAVAQNRAPSPPQPAPRQCTVAGLWRSSTTWVTDFSADGRWQTYGNVADARRATPLLQGTYSVDGTTMHFRVLNDGTSNTFRYRVTLTGNECESMRLVLTGDDRQVHQPGFTIDFTRQPEPQQ
jgi:hypothetical protein